MFNKKDKERIQVLEKEIKTLKKELEIKNLVSSLLDEAIPKGETERKRYMADISLFYATIFKEKLKHFIGLQMVELSWLGRSEKEYDTIRSNINCFHLINDWMAERTNEHLGNLEELRKKFKDDDEFISNFRNTYGENKSN